MLVLVTPDKFKGCLEASEVCRAMIEGIRLFDPQIRTLAFPLADGGEGTARILTHYAGGQMHTHRVADPLFRPVDASFGLSADGQTAFLEMAQASGLHLLRPDERNPMHTSSYGIGELMKRAIELGATRIVLGIGGSATNDGGIGMAEALGYRFWDREGNELPPIGRNLSLIARIDASQVLPELARVHVEVACDVDNPLTGARGASFVYGPQKGATPEEAVRLEEGLKHLARLGREQLGKDMEMVPGAGAAGGMGGGTMLFLGATLVSGVALILKHSRFEAHLENVDLILTGEGKLDAQTLRGKLVMGVVGMARERSIPVAAICGTLEAEAEAVRELGLAYAGSLIRRPCTLDEAMATAYAGIREQAFQIVSLFMAGRRTGNSLGAKT